MTRAYPCGSLRTDPGVTPMRSEVWFGHLMLCPDQRCRFAGAVLLREMATARLAGFGVQITRREADRA